MEFLFVYHHPRTAASQRSHTEIIGKGDTQ